MQQNSLHTFHIPVMGLAFTIDTPLKVARYGISSVVSIMDDELIEKMRAYHAHAAGEEFTPITEQEHDARALRITAYLNLLHRLVIRQTEELRSLPFEADNDMSKYFSLLPADSPIRQKYEQMLVWPEGEQKTAIQEELRQSIQSGAIDVNIMSKVDKTNYSEDGTPLPKEFSDALTALRGFAQSNLRSSVVFSAGYNPRLYAYAEQFPDFFPDANGTLKKKIILKVSDFRSAFTQGKILAKKGLWVSGFRIESGLNCGGHAFATEGLLMGPILEEFKANRQALQQELLSMCNRALEAKGLAPFSSMPPMSISVQGGIGTAAEHRFLLDYYQADSAGWGSPFLLVPEATNVDEDTLQDLIAARREDFYLSHASPLGIPFHNFKRSSSEKQRQERIRKGRPGSPCYKKMLSFNTEFTETPICTASRQYQDLKIKQLRHQGAGAAMDEQELAEVMEKDCLCEGLGAAALLKYHLPLSHQLSAVTICPGPNLAYFSEVFTLQQMADHIYGRTRLLNSAKRPHVFVNELELYVNYYREELKKSAPSPAQIRYLDNFRNALLQGIEYYMKLVSAIPFESPQQKQETEDALHQYRQALQEMALPVYN